MQHEWENYDLSIAITAKKPAQELGRYVSFISLFEFWNTMFITFPNDQHNSWLQAKRNTKLSNIVLVWSNVGFNSLQSDLMP